MLKFFALFAIVGLAAALQAKTLQSISSPNSRKGSTVSSGDDAHAEIRSLHSDVRADGFEYALETSNGIIQHQSGDASGNLHGDYEYVSPEGEHVKVSYVADENGYQPNSALLPTPPPIPAAILKALEYIRTHPPKDEVSYGNHASTTSSFGRKHK